MFSRRVKASIIAVALSSVIIVSVFILTLPLNPLDPDNPDTPDNPEPSVPDLDISEKTNLIPNAGFELGEYSSSGIPESWDYYEGNAEYEWVNDSAQAHTGSKCIRLGNAWNEDRPEDRPSLYSYVTPPAGIGIENRRFLMHMWTRIDNVSAGSEWLVVRYRIGSSTIDYDIFRCQNSTEWSSNDFVLETIPADTTAFRIDLMLDNAPGAVWFDDVFLVELNSTEYEAVSQVGRFSPLNWSGSTPAGTPSDCA
jgi:hypothetical protein